MAALPATSGAPIYDEAHSPAKDERARYVTATGQHTVRRGTGVTDAPRCTVCGHRIFTSASISAGVGLACLRALRRRGSVAA